MVNCPTCNSQLRYIEKNQRYYCDNCKAWQNTPAPAGGKNYKIVGTITPVLEYRISPGVNLYGQPGLLVSRDPSVTMQGKTKGGLGKALGRKLLTGETMTQMEYTGQGTVRLSAGYAGKIIDIPLSQTPLRAKSGAYVAAEEGVEVGTTTEKIGTAIIGGTGFFQLLMTGQGTVFLQSVGDIIEGTLGAGQSLIVDENHFLACDDSMRRERERVKGVRNIMTGGEGLYSLKLTGPGRYWIETGNLWTAASGAKHT
jgi:uncharacterized protein (TIGR00266 family)